MSAVAREIFKPSVHHAHLLTDDKGAAETIGYAHSEIELLLESINENWWMK